MMLLLENREEKEKEKEVFLVDWTSGYEELINRIDPKISEKWSEMTRNIGKKFYIF